MADALGVVARWSTDRGPVVTRGAYQGDLQIALQDMAKHLDAQGVFVVRVVRCFTMPVPIIDGQPAWTLAGKPERVSTAAFTVQHQDVLV